MIANSRIARASAALAVVLALSGGAARGDALALRLRALAVGAGASDAAVTIELYRWSTEAERSPLLAALPSPSPAPSSAPAEAGGAVAGRGGRAGRGARGGRGGAPSSSPLARLTAAVKAAPTLGFIWGDGVTGYSIKYAWRTPSAGDAPERIVLITDRRLGAHAPSWTPPAAAVAPDAEFTLIELRVDATGAGEAKASLTTNIVVDAAAQTLALDGYPSAPVLMKVTR